ncbi:MAG: hypothetical protein HYX41_02955 [Bdellovibrio sp.]|nr:hypothetical protein [Bdellovibrio sp.]
MKKRLIHEIVLLIIKSVKNFRVLLMVFPLLIYADGSLAIDQAKALLPPMPPPLLQQTVSATDSFFFILNPSAYADEDMQWEQYYQSLQTWLNHASVKNNPNILDERKKLEKLLGDQSKDHKKVMESYTSIYTKFYGATHPIVQASKEYQNKLNTPGSNSLNAYGNLASAYKDQLVQDHGESKLSENLHKLIESCKRANETDDSSTAEIEKRYSKFLAHYQTFHGGGQALEGKSPLIESDNAQPLAGNPAIRKKRSISPTEDENSLPEVLGLDRHRSEILSQNDGIEKKRAELARRRAERLSRLQASKGVKSPSEWEQNEINAEVALLREKAALQERLLKNREQRREVISQARALQEENRRARLARNQAGEQCLRPTQAGPGPGLAENVAAVVKRIPAPSSAQWSDAIGLRNQGNYCFTSSAFKIMASMPDFLNHLKKIKFGGDPDKEHLRALFDEFLSLLKNRENALLNGSALPMSNNRLSELQRQIIDGCARFPGFFSSIQKTEGAAIKQSDARVFLTQTLGFFDFTGAEIGKSKLRKSPTITLDPVNRPNAPISSFIGGSKELKIQLPKDSQTLNINRGGIKQGSHPVQIEDRITVRTTNGPVPMALTGVMVHYGSSNDWGHYVAYTYHPKTKTWYRHNDSSVMPISSEEIEDLKNCRIPGGECWKTDVPMFTYSKAS